MFRRPLPRLWLMTDERGGDPAAAARLLPRGSGIVFRHYGLPTGARRALFDRVRAVAVQRNLVLLLADRPALARAWGADGAHDRSPRRAHGIRTASVHNARERVAADRACADLIFVSPVFATNSHPDATPLGRARMGLVAGHARSRTIALGGMTERRFRSLAALGPYGWAGIEALSARTD